MSQLNVNIIKNRVGNNGPTISGNTTISGILTATKFVGDGEGLTGLPSAGLGTALSDDKTNPLNVIYYTDSNLGIAETITVDIPSSAKSAYTQYPQITLNDGADLIVTADNDFIPDILGISTTGGETLVGAGGRVRADNFTNKAGTGAPNFPSGLTGTTGTFTGNVSIGGTLTYQDVTNVDSVGMITARKGIQVLADGINAVGVITATSFDGTATNAQGLTGTPSITVNEVTSGGINAVGVVTATSFSGDGSNLDGIESGVANFVATGTISNGDTIVVNTDGTVSAISGSGSPEPIAGSSTTFETNTTTFTSVAYIPGGNKVVVAYYDSTATAGKAVVGTVSGNGITFGSAATFASGGAITFINCVYDTTNNKIVIVWNRGNSFVRSRVGTVSGTTITFPEPLVLVYGGNGVSIRAIFAAGKIIAAYSNSGGITSVGTVSGDTISWGVATGFQTGAINDIALAYDSDEQRVVYMYGFASNRGRARAGTIGATTVTFGREAYKLSGNLITDPSATYDPISKKIVLCFKDDDGANDSNSVAMTVNVAGDVLSFGNQVMFDYGTCGWYNTMYNSNDNKIIICYNRDSGTGGGVIAIATVIGNEITFNSPVEFESTSTAYNLGAAYDSTNNKVIVSYQQTGTSDGISRVIQPYGATTNLTSENYIGIAAEAITGGATGKINVVGGINSGQSSLTVGKKYYVQIDGSLATTPTDPAVVAGTSISATKIIVKG